MPMFPKLFELGRMGSLVLPNRTVLAATSSELAGCITMRCIERLGIPVHYAGDVGGARKFFRAIEEGP
jgi:hypothetical protein